jgi:hypothetical protein
MSIQSKSNTPKSSKKTTAVALFKAAPPPATTPKLSKSEAITAMVMVARADHEAKKAAAAEKRDALDKAVADGVWEHIRKNGLRREDLRVSNHWSGDGFRVEGLILYGEVSGELQLLKESLKTASYDHVRLGCFDEPATRRRITESMSTSKERIEAVLAVPGNVATIKEMLATLQGSKVIGA